MSDTALPPGLPAAAHTTAQAVCARRVVVVGGGPAGLMAAEVLATGGVQVDLYDAMPSVGRKFLLAGKGGLNLTHSEALPAFVGRYREQQAAVAGWLAQFSPQALRDWAAQLGCPTFVGSSGRVFPQDMKAAPLLRAWLARLRQQGVVFHMRQRWAGFQAPLSGQPPGLVFDGPEGRHTVQADAVVLALGGASWPRLGSDGAWWPWLAEQGVALSPLRAANCGFDVVRPQPDGGHAADWTAVFRQKFAGQPLKNVVLSLPAPGADSANTGAGGGGNIGGNTAEPLFRQTGEFVVTECGVEGSLVYAASAAVREAIAASGPTQVLIDLLPQHSPERVLREVSHPRGSRSLSSHLKGRLGLDGVKAGLVHELLTRDQIHHPGQLAAALKALPLWLAAPRPVAEAISTAGGVQLQGLDRHLMLHTLPGVFCAGEMLDWEAPTGGYLLSAAFASGRVAGQGALAWRTGRSG